MVELKYDAKGLIPAIIQDEKTNEVLMLGYMNKDSITKMIGEGKTCFYSRSRQKLWLKGETSGHVQRIKEIYTDCDNDTLLIKVEQVGGACHEGYRSCFFKKIDKQMNTIEIIGEKIFNPKDTYKK
ncbi:MAG: phosphoribosyl-AMP cyclohydrolase [Candidatus Omnitrophica bacterium]|nr:phosphoribosyl-AMP cyclohydrolase [Candidatus Omnitrophota bacterium]